MVKLSDLVIMSDVDGTLLNAPCKTPRRNIDALERFVSKGGRFGIATGRSLEFARPLLEELPVNFPCVLSNGCVIYDFAKEEYLMEQFLPGGAKAYMRELASRFPDCGALLTDRKAYYDIDGRAKRFFVEVYPNHSLIEASLDEIQGPWYKGLMLLHQPHRMGEVHDFAAGQNFDGVRFVSTDIHLLEMLPERSSKGEALSRLGGLLGIERKNFVAIGDYYNDIEMIEYAGIGATLRSAPEAIRALAGILVCDCKDGALADLVEILEREYE